MKITLEIPDSTFMLTVTYVHIVPEKNSLGCSVRALNSDNLTDGNIIDIKPTESEGAE